MTAHQWVARAFFELTPDQAAEVAIGTAPGTVGELIPDARYVGCSNCDLAWSPLAAELPCGVQIGRNDPCPCGSGLKLKKCHETLKEAVKPHG